MNDWQKLVQQRIDESLAAKRKLLEISGEVARAGELMLAAVKAGKALYIFGNGGSAADAQHIAAELVGKYYHDRPALPAVALSTNTSSVTAIGNDYAYAKIFSRQLEAFGREGDVAIGISTSGNSENVLEAMKVAKARKMHTVALTGATGGKLKGVVDLCLCAPSTDTPRIQECHILVGHVWCEIVESGMYPRT